MSAIFGAYNFCEQSNQINSNIVDKFSEYKFDKIEKYEDSKNSFYCFHQFITEESKYEVLPYYDEESQVLITSDAIIDNREDLIVELGIEDNTISDSMIILESYKKWGKLSAKKLIGDFAYAIFDYKVNELYLVRDQLGKRTLYYSQNEKIFKFSTIMNPLIDNPKELNASYMKMFLASKISLDQYDERETIYKDILNVKPASILSFVNGKVEEDIYWSLPKKIKTLNKYSQEVLVEFKRIMNEAVHCRLRTIGNVGVLLSGGYDSSSIGCKAAELLIKENKNLFTYTSISSKKYEVDIPKYCVCDETDFVLDMKKKYPNMINRLIDSEDISPIVSGSELTKILEKPFAYQMNGFWINDCLVNAKKDECRVILNGAKGNSMFSYTSLDRYYYYLIKKGKFVKFFKEERRTSRILGLSRKKNWKNLFLLIIFNKSNLKQSLNEYVYLDSSELKKMESIFDVLNSSKNLRLKLDKSFKNLFDGIMLNHIGESETKFGLKYNLIQRDPTRDIRIIEFCHKLGIEYYNYGGNSRTLAQYYMDKLVPESVLTNPKRGIQGADVIHRLEVDWDKVIKYIEMKINLLESILDKDLVVSYIHKNAILNMKYDYVHRSDVNQILKIYNTLCFIDGIS